MSESLEYEPSEAQIRNLMRYSGVRMSDAVHALREAHGVWDDAVAFLEATANRRGPRRASRGASRC